ncbi:helix-turn-helix transcriptional regulator [Paragemmobacter straminiformis]|uniref:Helix-turn-helix transcriptional regulator n=1 Tax=Paragemmobacter straminiformis TaxID=2045119 RepID=A0A842IAU1_9RHOB|nr:helix-turn-helix transcriptional regulator [Gemmobacter straminiformis]MBC2836731.1 helix-turn-helix transcriptional regulator [Gemmobacter straminiformis]
MQRDEALAAVIRAQGGAGFTPALLVWLAAVAAPDSVVGLAFGADGPPRVLFRQARATQVFARLEAGYLAGAYLLDPFHALHLRQAGAGAYRLCDVAPDAFSRSRYHEEYYRDTTLLDEIVLLARPQAGMTLMLCLGRDATSGTGFDAADWAACRAAAPVAAALAERQWGGLQPGGSASDVVTALIAAARQRDIGLSRRQAEVALMILRGHSTASIALGLGVSAQTVKVFRRQLYMRCAISSQAELFALMLPMLANRISSAAPTRTEG